MSQGVVIMFLRGDATNRRGGMFLRLVALSAATASCGQGETSAQGAGGGHPPSSARCGESAEGGSGLGSCPAGMYCDAPECDLIDESGSCVELLEGEFMCGSNNACRLGAEICIHEYAGGGCTDPYCVESGGCDDCACLPFECSVVFCDTTSEGGLSVTCDG